MKRDVERLEFAKKKGTEYVYFILESGIIIGQTKQDYDTYSLHKDYDKKYEKMTIEEYEWFTDKTRETKIVTAADLYDKIEWTGKGFKIDGENVPIN